MAQPAADPTQRLHAACLAAMERTATGPRGSSRFASLGESLFWLSALAEAKGKRRSPGLILGMTWARDRIAHGVLMVEPTVSTNAFTMRLSNLRGSDYLRGGFVWRARRTLVFSRTQQHDPAGEAAYDVELAGMDVMGRLHAGLAEVMGQPVV